jgi:chitinase
VPNAFSNYANIMSEMLHQGFVRYWDATASAPFLYNPAKRTFVSYEDVESIALKCRYVREHKLGGVMFWDYSGDLNGALLNAINIGLGRITNGHGITGAQGQTQ